jgi:hypothetical protein
MEGLAEETESSARGTTVGKFFCKGHADLSLCLTKECRHSLTEKTLMQGFDCSGQVTFLVVAS